MHVFISMKISPLKLISTVTLSVHYFLRNTKAYGYPSKRHYPKGLLDAKDRVRKTKFSVWMKPFQTPGPNRGVEPAERLNMENSALCKKMCSLSFTFHIWG